MCMIHCQHGLTLQSILISKVFIKVSLSTLTEVLNQEMIYLDDKAYSS